MKDLKGRTAVVTGGASGIGRAMVDRFAAEGMRVVVSDVDQAGIDAAVADVTGLGGEAIGVRTDVSQRAAVEALAAAAVEAFGAVHVVCNNAGVVVGGRVEDLTEEEWRWVVDVDLWGPVHGVRVFLPLLESGGEGHIVSTSSTSGLGVPVFNAPYSVAKAGVIALMETVRRELEDRGSPVGASVLCPGPVATPLIARSAEHARGAVAARSETDEGRRFDEVSDTLLQVGVAPDRRRRHGRRRHSREPLLDPHPPRVGRGHAPPHRADGDDRRAGRAGARLISRAGRPRRRARGAASRAGARPPARRWDRVARRRR